MSFEVNVKTVDEISKHPNADKLEILDVDGNQICAGIDDFEVGDKVALIEPDSLVPQEVQEELGVENYLNNKRDNMGRVREVRLRGEKSEGLLYPAKDEWEIGQDVKAELGVEKYVPPVPTQMNGQVCGGLSDLCISYDANNYRRHPDVFDENDEVVFMEKVHGTWCQMGVVPDEMRPERFDENLIVASKGLAKKGQPFIPQAEENEDNVYLRKAKSLDIVEKLKDYVEENGPVFVLGEIFGDGIQELEYGATTKHADEDIGFRVFDVYVGKPGEGQFLNFDKLSAFCKNYNLDLVPVLYRHYFDPKRIAEFRGGIEQVSGNAEHIREGIVIRPVEEEYGIRQLPMGGRKQLKAKSYDYLMKGSDKNEQAVRTKVVRYNGCFLNERNKFTEELEDAGLFSEGSVEDVLETLRKTRPELNEDEFDVENVKVTYKKDGRLRNDF